MKTLFVSLLAIAALIVPASAQTNTLGMTTLTSAMDSTQNYAVVASSTGLVANRALYIDNELMTIKATYLNLGTTASLTVPVVRLTLKKSGHISGAMVLSGRENWFNTYDPFGACTASAVFASPWINIATGDQFLCSTILGAWGPGFQNRSLPTSAIVSTVVASAAGVILPSGPLFHVTGTAAITGFTVPVGLGRGGFCIIPDGAFTTTTAGNIAFASTAVVSKTICYTYDPNAAKPFFPSY